MQIDVLIVGAGHAGAQAAIALRQAKFHGTIVLVGEERTLPYHRPPLSKDYLANRMDLDRLLIRQPQFWMAQEVSLILGRRVVEVDGSAQTVTLDDGVSIGYGALIWATGGYARRLDCAGNDLRGVHTVRNVGDVDRIKSELAAVSSVAVVGAGYVGLETAAALSQLGKKVTVLEREDRVLTRVAGPTVAGVVERLHRHHGVDVQYGADVCCVEGTAGTVSGVRLMTGEVVLAQLVIVGIGIIPATAPLLAAGARGGNGVAVDQFCRTSLANVYAIGDCALHPNRYAGGAAIRLESVQNANDMANTAARCIMGTPTVYETVPWFWSHQFDVQIQTVGLFTGYTREVVRGNPAQRSFSVAYLREDRVIAIDCINSPKDYVQAKGLIAADLPVDVALVADPAVALKDCIR